MTTLEYMEKQLHRHIQNYDREKARGVPQHMLENILLKISYYKDAVVALKMVGDLI